MDKEDQNPSDASLNEGNPPRPLKQIEPPTPDYIRKKKRRLALWTLVGITGAGVLALGIIAFLGQNFGTFTVKLVNDEDATLEMGTVLKINEQKATGINSPTTYLDAQGTSAVKLLAADELPEDSILDADLTSDNETQVRGLKEEARRKVAVNDSSVDGTFQDVYFAYTFYLRNVSLDQVTYQISFKATDNILPSNLYDEKGNEVSVSLEKFIRIRVFENIYTGSELLVSHAQKTYAYPASTVGGNTAEIVSSLTAIRPENREFCVNFIDIDTSTHLFTVFDDQEQGNTRTLKGEQIVRYSVVMWFEGNDKDTEGGVSMPHDGSLAFGIDIAAKKTKALESSLDSSSID